MSVYNTPIEVTYTASFEVEETTKNSVILKGPLIRLDIPTGNKRVYRFSEAAQIIKEAIGKAVHFGADKLGKHLKSGKDRVGRVIRAWLDKATKTIWGLVEVWNTKDYPNLTEEVKTGWGFSIGGVIDAFRPIFKAGKTILECINFKFRQLQLLKPSTPRGDVGAKVSEVIPVQESLQLSENPWDLIEKREEAVPVPVTYFFSGGSIRSIEIV